jgi:aspartokinase
VNLIELASNDIKDEKSIRIAAERAVGALSEKPVILVAGLGETNRTLIEAGEKSADQDIVLGSALAEGLRTYHMQLAQQVTSPAVFRETRALLSGLFEELSDLLKGLYLLEECSAQARLALSRYGERAAAIVLAHVLRSLDAPSTAFYMREVFQEPESLREEVSGLVEKSVIPVLPLSLRTAISS